MIYFKEFNNFFNYFEKIYQWFSKEKKEKIQSDFVDLIISK